MAFEGVAKQEIEEIHRIVAEMDRYEREAVRRRGRESTAETCTTSLWLAVGAVLQLVLLASVYYLILIHHDIMQRRRIANELKRHSL